MTGMYTHFAVADTDPVFTQQQLDIFTNIVKFARINLGLKFIAHTANSAALFRNKRTHLDLVCPGISIYVLMPFKHAERFLKLKPVLSWKTKIIFLKKVPSGFCVSYGRIFVTNRASVIATIPVEDMPTAITDCCLINLMPWCTENAVRLPEELQWIWQ
jgi:alanine racemase